MAEIPGSSSNSHHHAIKVLIEGRVHGVWFRGWTVENARRLNLDGWVLNRRDGSVQAVFSGPAERVDEMLRLCSEGPPAADVSKVEYILHDSPVDVGFRIRRSV
jgi:acylphosphatase